MDKFTKNDTLVIKGIAILMLLCHHFFMGILAAPIDWSSSPKITIIATLSKVCVAVFVVLSGYGINESRKRSSCTETSFVRQHLFKLMKQYWFIFIIFVPLGILCQWNPFDIYGRNFKGLIYFAIDFLGMKSLLNTPTMNQTWWYMETVIVLYIFYPIIRRLISKLPLIFLAVSFVPIVIYTYFSDGSYDTCREIFWIFPFAVGILLSEKNILNRFSKFLSEHFSTVCPICIAFALIMTAVRSHFGLIADTFYAIAIIAAAKATVCRMKYVSSALEFLGVHSANIFMMHSFMYCYYVPIKQMLMVVRSGIVNYFILLAECLIISDYIEISKRRISAFKKQFVQKRE